VVHLPKRRATSSFNPSTALHCSANQHILFWTAYHVHILVWREQKKSQSKWERRGGEKRKSLWALLLGHMYLRWGAWFNVAWIPNIRQNCKNLPPALYQLHQTSWCSSSSPLSIWQLATLNLSQKTGYVYDFSTFPQAKFLAALHKFNKHDWM
jgi:hypothetical protein